MVRIKHVTRGGPSGGRGAANRADPHMPVDLDQRRVYTALLARQHLAPHYLDMEADPFATLGRGASEAALKIMTQIGWPGLLAQSNLCYPQLTSEILATYSYTSHDGARFSVAGEPQTLSREDLYDCFEWPIDNLTLCPDDRSFHGVWETLTGSSVPYIAKTSSAFQIKDPVFRILLRAISATLTARSDSTNRVNATELWLLYCMLHGLRPDFLRMLNLKFTETAAATKGAILVGGFCTQLARATGAFDPETTTLVPLKKGAPIDQAYCARLQIFSRAVVNKEVVYTLLPKYKGWWPSCPEYLVEEEEMGAAGDAGDDTADMEMGDAAGGESSAQAAQRQRTAEQPDGDAWTDVQHRLTQIELTQHGLQAQLTAMRAEMRWAFESSGVVFPEVGSSSGGGAPPPSPPFQQQQQHQ